MDKDNYKTAVDSVKFSETFERDTIELMRRAAGCAIQKEEDQMNTRKITRKTIKVSAIAVAFIAVFAVTAFALPALLSPKDVATQMGDNALAGAFDSDHAIIIDQSVQAGDYTIALQGIVSGKGLTDYYEEAQEDKSYIVASVAYTDGTAIAGAGETGITFSPLVAGYKPWQVNAWTLGGSSSSFVHDGVNYFIFECANLEIFADHTIYLAAYEGFAPSAEIFKMGQSGEITYVDTFTKPHAIFTLPLDPAKADPDAAAQLLESRGIIVQ